MTGEYGRAVGCWLTVLVVLATVGGAALLAPASAQTTDDGANGTTVNGTNGSGVSATATETPANGTTPANASERRANATNPPKGERVAAGGGRGSAAFNRSTVTENRGDIAAIELDLTGTNRATVTVGSRAVNYETNVTVSDGGDGRVTLLMNSYLAGTVTNETRAYGVDNATDTVVRTNRTTERLDAPLETSTYNLSVAVDGRETDTAALELTERTTDELVTWTAPTESFGNVTNASEATAAIETGRITTADSVAVGDVLVLQSKVSGVHGAFAAANLSELVERGTVGLTIRQTNPDTNRQPKRLDLDRSLANDSIRVVPDPGNDTLYVDVDTGAAVFERGPPRPGDAFEARLTVREASNLAARNQSISANVTMVGAELGLGDVSLAADAGQTVTGTTSVAPGSEVTVRIAANATDSFVKTNDTTVSPNGSFATAFNLSAIPPNTTADVRAAGPLGTSDNVTTRIRPTQESARTAGPARLGVANQTTTGETVRVRNVTLPEGGYVVAHAPNASDAPVTSVLGTSSYLDTGTTENVTVTLTDPLAETTDVVVMAHRDTNDNQVYDFGSSNGSEDGPYTSPGSGDATATADGTASDGTPVATRVRIAVRNATATTAAEAASGGGNDSDAAGGTTTETGPGFGVGLAVVAFVLIALAVRRQ